MNPTDHRDPADPLHRALRDLPDVSAPASLENRVFTALGERAALPWWRQPVTAWPVAAQAGLVALSLAAATGLTLVVPDEGASLEVGDWITPFSGGWTALQGLGEAASATVAVVPPVLFLGAIAAGVIAAVTLGGGVAAYRSLCNSD